MEKIKYFRKYQRSEPLYLFIPSGNSNPIFWSTDKLRKILFDISDEDFDRAEVTKNCPKILQK